MANKLFIVLLILSCANCVNMHILIDISPMELQSIGEVLVESYLHHNLIQRKPSIGNTMLSVVQKCACQLFQFIGITCSLVGANILTSMLQQSADAPTATTFNSSLVPSKLCNHDYGCDDNVCWRSCKSNGKSTEDAAWCYSTPDPKLRKYQQCLYQHDCSPCWECLGTCNAYVP